MKKTKKTKFSKKTLVVTLLLIIFIAFIFIINAKNINIKNIKDIKDIKIQGLVIGLTQRPSHDQLVSIALTYPQVQAFVAGRQYTTNVKTVSEEDIEEMPVLFSGLSVSYGELYMVDFKSNSNGLRVVMDDKEVKRVFPITYLSVS